MDIKCSPENLTDVACSSPKDRRMPCCGKTSASS